MTTQLRTYRSRSVTVHAIQFDGRNLQELERAIEVRTGREAFLAPVMDVGCWVVFQGKGFTVLPNKMFERIYEPVEDEVVELEELCGRTFVTVSPRSCFDCIHLTLSGHCSLFNDPVHDEFDAASDCSAYEVEGQ